MGCSATLGLVAKARVACDRIRLCCRASSQARLPSSCKHVVTSFVERPSDGAVLVVLRSEKVGTYQRKWGAVSGGMEAGDESPVWRAEQEIVEEVGLAAGQMQLVRSGRPLLVDDGRLHFAVHPFLFRLREEHPLPPLTLNWENDEVRWVTPCDLRRLETVPQLAETYERLRVSDAQAAALRRLAEDRCSGAAQLARQAVAELAGEAATLGADQGREGAGAAALADLRNWGYHLAIARPSMAAVANAVAVVLAAAHEQLHSRADAFEAPLQEVCAVVRHAAAAEERRLAGCAAAVQRQALRLLRDGMMILTTSLSSSVLAALRGAAEQGLTLKAVVCEARPLCEGVQLAAALAEAGVECTLITDAQAALFVSQCSMVLVGADEVTEAAAVNKAGTRLLALAAREAGVPVYALADSGKVSPGPLLALAHPGWQQATEGEEKAAEEVTAAWDRPTPAGVAVRNVYFEPVPLGLLTVVTEDGLVDQRGIARMVEERRRQYQAAFQLGRLQSSF